MKPVIIYTMPRTRSTAALEACLRTKKIKEPFNPYNLFNVDPKLGTTDPGLRLAAHSEFIKDVMNLYPYYLNSISVDRIDRLFGDLNSPDTATKIFGLDLVDFLPGRKWFSDCSISGTHDIFVLVRDLREQLFSFLLAPIFGYNTYTSVEPYQVHINMEAFYYLRKNIDSFLRFFPENAKLVKFEDLPESHFDKNLIKLEDQKSLTKLSFIKNLAECEKHIDALQKYFYSQWTEKINSLR